MRVVFDTNILISALLFPGGRGEAALWRIIHGRDELLWSKPILDELLATLARKFSRDAEELARLAVFIGDIATVVHPRRRLAVVKDEPDNRVLECALTGRADAIVTGDRGLLALHQFRGVRLLTLREYLGSSEAGSTPPQDLAQRIQARFKSARGVDLPLPERSPGEPRKRR